MPTCSKGSTYFGQYSAGLRNGYGACRFFNGDYYEGSWANGLRDGQGMQQVSARSWTCVWQLLLPASFCSWHALLMLVLIPLLVASPAPFECSALTTATMWESTSRASATGMVYTAFPTQTGKLLMLHAAHVLLLAASVRYIKLEAPPTHLLLIM